MLISKQEKTKNIKGLRLFGNIQVLAVSALFIALSIILGKYLSFTIGAFRLSFENLTILLSGIIFGPVIGFVTGAAADIIGCLLVGYAINPIITVGAGIIGLVAGLSSHYIKSDKKAINIAVSVALAHILGSMIIKSIGLHLYFGFPYSTLLLRVPLYLFIGTLEFYIIYLLMKNTAFIKQMERMQRK